MLKNLFAKLGNGAALVFGWIIAIAIIALVITYASMALAALAVLFVGILLVTAFASGVIRVARLFARR